MPAVWIDQLNNFVCMMERAKHCIIPYCTVNTIEPRCFIIAVSDLSVSVRLPVSLFFSLLLSVSACLSVSDTHPPQPPHPPHTPTHSHIHTHTHSLSLSPCAIQPPFILLISPTIRASIASPRKSSCLFYRMSDEQFPCRIMFLIKPSFSPKRPSFVQSGWV